MKKLSELFGGIAVGLAVSAFYYWILLNPITLFSGMGLLVKYIPSLLIGYVTGGGRTSLLFLIGFLVALFLTHVFDSLYDIILSIVMCLIVCIKKNIDY